MSVTTRSSSKGVSLSRGPALLLGGVLLVAGLFFLYRAHTFPRFAQFPSGTAHIDVKAFFGVFGVNGWSGELTAAAGGALLLGAAQHLLAKTASLVVAVALGGVAVWALVDHHSALGLFAANIWTIVGWGGAAALLFINTLLPRPAGSTTATQPAASRRVTPVAARPITPAPAPAAAPAVPVTAAPVTTRPVTPEPPTRVEPTSDPSGAASPPGTEVTRTPPGLTTPTREL